MMIEDDKILWSLLVDHQLFAVTKLDINVSGPIFEYHLL